MDRDMSPVEPDLSTSLRTFARGAAVQAASVLETGGPRAGTHAAAWMRAAREALEAARVAEEPLSDSEREVIAAQIRELRRQADTAWESRREIVEQRDGMAELLASLIAEFASADTPVATRVSARIQRELVAIFPDAAHRRDAAEDVPA